MHINDFRGKLDGLIPVDPFTSENLARIVGDTFGSEHIHHQKGALLVAAQDLESIFSMPTFDAVTQRDVLDRGLFGYVLALPVYSDIGLLVGKHFLTHSGLVRT